MAQDNKYNFIEVVRCRANSFGTFGRLFLNDEFVCYTLEPAPNSSIPLGIYRLRLDRPIPKYCYRSPYSKYKGCVPYFESVGNFEGVVISIGNFLHQTSGAILVGEQASIRRIYRSTAAWLKLMKLLDKHIATYICISTIARRPLAASCNRKSKNSSDFSVSLKTSPLNIKNEYDVSYDDLPF